jgi:predicted dehydrogenase
MGLQHVRAARRSGAIDLVAYVDPDETARRRAGDECPASTSGYARLPDMLASESPDVVIVATTTMHHHAAVIASLEAGCHVLCEKPLAATLRQSDHMLAAALAADRRLLINNEYNVHPRTRAALATVRSGRIGDVLAMRGSFKGNFPGGFDLAEGAPHLFSLAMLVAGQPARVAAEFVTGSRRSGVADIFDGAQLPTLNGGWLVGDRVTVEVEFAHGRQLHAEFFGVPTLPSLSVLGADGVVFLPYGAVVREALFASHLNDPLASWTTIQAEYPAYAAPVSLAGADPDVVYTELNQRAVAVADTDWADWLLAGGVGEHPMNAAQGLRAQEIVHAAYTSHFDHQSNWVSLPLTQRDHPLERRVGGYRS